MDNGKNILILGASGLVGGNCLRYFKTKKEYKVLGTYFSYPTEETVKYNTLNPNDPENADIESFNPDVILHCGALTWVDYCEENPEESWDKTVKSTHEAVNLSKKFNAKLIYISTDYVFDGKDGPYLESAPLNPLSIYGKHKLEAENYVQQELKEFLILRITNVYGDEERNKNFIARMLQNAIGDEPLEIKLPFDQYATPVNAADIARAMYLLLGENKNGIYHIASTDFVNRMQLAQTVLKHFSEHKVKLIPIDTETLNPPAKRPLIGGLIAQKFLSEHPDFEFSNVDDYLLKKIAEQ